MNESLNGSFDGIGVQFNMVDDSLLVIQPVVNGPSEKVGIIAGDRIVAVNDTAIAGVKMSKEEIMKRLRGPKGTIVNLTVVRRGIKDKLSFRVKRDKIPVTTMDAAPSSSTPMAVQRLDRSSVLRPTDAGARASSWFSPTSFRLRQPKLCRVPYKTRTEALS